MGFGVLGFLLDWAAIMLGLRARIQGSHAETVCIRSRAIPEWIVMPVLGVRLRSATSTKVRGVSAQCTCGDLRTYMLNLKLSIVVGSFLQIEGAQDQDQLQARDTNR